MGTLVKIARQKAAVSQLISQNIEAHFISLDILKPESIAEAGIKSQLHIITTGF